MVPLAQLFDGDAEAISYCNQCVGSADLIALAGSETAACSDRDDEFVASFKWLGGSDVIEGGDLGGVDVQGGRDLVKGLAVLHNVEAPARTILFGNVLEALEEDVMRARRNMQVVRDVARGGESQQCRVECDDLGNG